MKYVALNAHVVYRDLYGGLMGSQVVCSAKLNTLHLLRCVFQLVPHNGVC